ncbi:MAG: hypothetical protein IKE34_08940, partial [Paenibacillus sp.]|nr:hypothetical protein [Paenibacillus sp.]
SCCKKPVYGVRAGVKPPKFTAFTQKDDAHTKHNVFSCYDNGWEQSQMAVTSAQKKESHLGFLSSITLLT